MLHLRGGPDFIIDTSGWRLTWGAERYPCAGCAGIPPAMLRVSKSEVSLDLALGGCASRFSVPQITRN